MNIETAKKAAAQFMPEEEFGISLLGDGLIHHTYKVSAKNSDEKIVLQAINTAVFSTPEFIIHNYETIYQFLQYHDLPVRIPAPVTGKSGNLLWEDEKNNQWRATVFVDGSYSPMTAADEKSAYVVANCFARFTNSLAGLEILDLIITLPFFHDLSYRYQQFEEAIEKAPIERLLKATHTIAELRERKKLVHFFESIVLNPNYPERVMHHDCKISNILFDKESGEVICPVDLDTVMPGHFFSDLGDMIRSMACTVDENSIAWEQIEIRPNFYKNIVQGYLDGIGNIFTEDEISNIHYAGLLMIYIQSLRFVTDFLNGDIYYKTAYPEQNLNRALNQLILLEKLEIFLETSYPSFRTQPSEAK